MTTALAAVVLALVVLEAGPMLVAGFRALGAPVVADTPRLRLRIESSVADDLTAFGRTADYLAEHTVPGEAVLPFPATAGVLFAAGLRNPVPHDYWFPGRPSHADEMQMLATLRAAPPRFIATLNQGWTFFIDAPEYFCGLRAWVVANYRLVARTGRFDVLARADVAPTLPRMIDEPAPGTAGEAVQPWLPLRRQNARRWMTSLTPLAAGALALASTDRDTILLLRALRDGGNLKGAGWLFAAYASPNPRIHKEAESAMERVAQEFEACRYRWADDCDLAVYRPYVERYAGDLVRLANSESAKVRKFASEIAEVLRAGPSAPCPGRAG